MKQLFSVIVLIVLSVFVADANLAVPLLDSLDVEYSYDRTGSGQKLGKSVYVGPKPKYPFRPGLFRSPIWGTGGTFIPVDTVVEAGTTVSTDYFGAYEYENGKFARLNTATGYRDSVGTHVYVRDWQGNIRAVVRKGDDGSTVLEQATYYYPYGMPMAESTNPTANRYKYTGKELLTDKGVNIYDYIARAYDPATCRWWSVDEHSADYSPLSHYSMCGGDPINFVDQNGKDIFILNYGNGEHQHLAMLIQNDEGKWQYYSINGDNKYLSGNHIGGRPFNDVAVGSWDSPQDFLDSDYNGKNENSKNDPNYNNYGFNEGFQIKTTREQDAVMRDAFKQAANSEYNLLSNNCATIVQDVMNEAGVPTSEPQYVPMTKPVSTILGVVDVFDGYQMKCDTKVIPIVAFKSIMKWNPSGQYIHK